MKSTVEHLNPTRVKLTVEVPFDELAPHFRKAYGALASQVRVPGFRPGKVPAKILDARLGRGQILSEVVNDAVPAKYGQAVSENSISPLGQPDIEVTKIEDNDVLEFTAEVDVRPEIILPAVGEIAVTVDDVEVTAADIDEQLDALRDRFATTTAAARAAVDGDLVSIDLAATVDGEVLEDATADGLSYTIGTGDLVDGIDDAIVGLAAGESATFTTQLVAGEHAGHEAEVTVTVVAVNERVRPEVDDDFAQLASEFDTVDDLRADLADRVTRVKNMSQGAQARDRVLEALLGMTEIAVPEGVVKAEIEVREHDAIHSFNHDEAAFATYLEGEGKTREEFDAEIRESSEEAVRTQLLLDALAEQDGVGVTQEEFTERVIYNAQRFGVSPDEYFKRLQDANQMGSIFADVRRGKALANAVGRATITSASGVVLNIDELFGIEADEADGDYVDGSVVDGSVVEGSVVEGSPEALDDDGIDAVMNLDAIDGPDDEEAVVVKS